MGLTGPNASGKGEVALYLGGHGYSLHSLSDVVREEAVRRAKERGLSFTEETGDLRLIDLLVNGPWDTGEFLVVQPGERIVATHDERIIAAEPDQG